MRNFVVLCVFVGFFSCSSDKEKLPSYADVSGIYTIISGYQAYVYEDGSTARQDFTETDGIDLQVIQSGNAIKLHTCMGTLNEDLEVQCSSVEEQNIWGLIS